MHLTENVIAVLNIRQSIPWVSHHVSNFLAFNVDWKAHTGSSDGATKSVQSILEISRLTDVVRLKVITLIAYFSHKTRWLECSLPLKAYFKAIRVCVIPTWEFIEACVKQRDWRLQYLPHRLVRLIWGGFFAFPSIYEICVCFWLRIDHLLQAKQVKSNWLKWMWHSIVVPLTTDQIHVELFLRCKECQNTDWGTLCVQGEFSYCVHEVILVF